MEEFITENYLETQKVGFLTAQKILNNPNNTKSTVVALNGELGAGKTTFLQGFGKGLGIRASIQSPTFIIMNHFQIKNQKFTDYYHFDWYRLETERDLEVLDFAKLISNPQNIICIEWGKNIESALPKERIEISFEILQGDRRRITIK